MNSPEEKSRWYKVRKLFNDLHLWMGLSSGLIVIVICFSGTVYVFNTEFKELASPGLYLLNEHPGMNPLKAEAIIRKIESATAGKVQSLKIPEAHNRTWQVSVRMPVAEDHGRPVEGGARNTVTVYAVNPFSGEIIGDISNNKNSVTEFMRTMFSLHRWLLLDRIEEPIFGELPNRKLGSYITGTATILFTLGALTGLIIWFPKKLKTWSQGLRIKWGASWKRLNHDLHNTLAFYSLIFLLLMGVTGPQWSFPWYREGLQKMLGTYSSPDGPKPTPVQSKLPGSQEKANMVSADDYLKSAEKVLAYRGDYTIVLPADSSSVVAVSKNRTGFFAPSAADKLSLDQYSGAVLETAIFSEKPFNERVGGSIKALHLGEVYGTFTKILYFIACLVATSLPVTGTLIWLNKLKKKRKKAVKKTSRVSYSTSAFNETGHSSN